MVLTLAAVTLSLVFAPFSLAEPGKLHEYIPNVATGELKLIVPGTAKVIGFFHKGELVRSREEFSPAPQAVLTSGQALETRAFQADRVTEFEGNVSYSETFTPAITPFKRMTALDQINLATDGITPVFTIRDPRLSTIHVENIDPNSRDHTDLFWAAVTIDFSQGPRVAIPSVSPESRILFAKTAPRVDIEFQKDGADNYFVRLKSTNPHTPVRLTFLTNAPKSYFAVQPPPLAANTLANEVPPFPDKLRARALKVAQSFALSPDKPLDQVLNTLVGYFRSFEESPTPPKNTGDLFVDLAYGKKGVCRHRAYAFVILAQSLGIPSRFVQNEAHAWVEVKLASIGWTRIDLGGAAHGLQTSSTDSTPPHEPTNPDPFPRPANYEQNMAPFYVRENESNDQSATANHANNTNSPSNESENLWTVELDNERYEVFRGRALEVSGRVIHTNHGPVSRMRVELFLKKDKTARRLGVTVSDAHGYFHASFGVPAGFPPGDYELVPQLMAGEAPSP